MPEIRRITGVSGYATPCTWHVETNKGNTSFILKAEEDIRRLAPPTPGRRFSFTRPRGDKDAR